MRAGQARLAGREEEEATCCHGSGPTYQHLHHSLTRLRCLVAWREPVACSVGWAATTAAGNWSHLTWPLHPPTHLPPRCRKWPERGLGQQPGHPEPSTVKAVGRGPLDLSRLAAQPLCCSSSLHTCLRDTGSAQIWKTLGLCLHYLHSSLPCSPHVAEAAQSGPKQRLKTSRHTQGYQVTWTYLHSEWDLPWPQGNLLNKYHPPLSPRPKFLSFWGNPQPPEARFSGMAMD